MTDTTVSAGPVLISASLVSVGWFLGSLHLGLSPRERSGGEASPKKNAQFGTEAAEGQNRQKKDSTDSARIIEAGEGQQEAGAEARRPAKLYMAVAWALGACFTFGFTHWLTGVVQNPSLSPLFAEEVDRGSVIELMCVFSGLASSLLNHCILRGPSGPTILEDYRKVLGLHGDSGQSRPHFAALLVGPMQFAALTVQRHVLSEDLHDAGPLLAIVSSDTVIISLFFFFVAGESMGRLGVAGVAAIVLGNTVSSMAIATRAAEPVAVMLSFVAMLGFAASAILMRLASSRGTSAAASFVIRCQTLALAAVIWSVVSGGFGRQVDLPFVAANLGLAVLHDSGIFCITRALAYPLAGICSAIWGSNALVIFALNAAILSDIPNTQAIGGMTCTMLGILACALSSKETMSDAPVLDVAANGGGTPSDQIVVPGKERACETGSADAEHGLANGA